MRNIHDETRWYDGDRVEEGRRKARMILPRGREDACTDKRIGDRLVRRFRLRKGDRSGTEAKQYAARLADAPGRAMQVYDIAAADRRVPGQIIEASYMVGVQPGAPQSADWLVIDQHNSAPKPGSKARWRSPGFGLCLRPDKRGNELLHVEVRTDPDDPADNGKLLSVCDPVPFSRGPHRIDRSIRFGPEGTVLVRMDGKPICMYFGPVGYLDHAYAFWSFGAYRSPWCPKGEEVTIHFEDWREAVA